MMFELSRSAMSHVMRRNVYRLALAMSLAVSAACEQEDLESVDEARVAAAATVVPLVGYRADDGVRIYEPFEPDAHAADAATTIPGISGLWVRRPELSDDPDLWLVLEYLEADSNEPLQVELTWVGPETVTVSSGAQPWSSSRFPATGTRLGTRLTGPAIVPTGDGVSQTMSVRAAGSLASFRIWLDQGAARKPAGDRPIVRPVLVHEETLTPTPTD